MIEVSEETLTDLYRQSTMVNQNWKDLRTFISEGKEIIYKSFRDKDLSIKTEEELDEFQKKFEKGLGIVREES